MLRQRQPRVKSPSHLAYIRKLPCLISKQTVSVEAAHIRYSDARYDKSNPGIGSKSDDRWCVPLSSWWHRNAPDSQHNVGDERAFWDAHGIDPCAVALSLWDVSGDIDAGTQIILRTTARE